jgi:aminoglycoside phosphotransferase (APT) family kinase protein
VSAEVSIDDELIRRLLRDQFPRWADLPLTRAPQFGTDNATYRLGANLVVRLPRFARWAEQVPREHQWLPWLAPQLPMTIPVPLGKGEPGHGYPFAWSVYRWLEGQDATLDRIADPTAAAVTLAEFVLALQRIPADGGPGPRASNAFRGVPMGDPAPSIAHDPTVRTNIAALAGLFDVERVMRVWEAALAAPSWAGSPRWIHGDLAPTNLLAVGGALSAVIDFGCLGVGDPACDLMAAWLCLPSRARDVFRGMLAVDDATWARGRGWALAMSVGLARNHTDPKAPNARRVLTDLLADGSGG